MSRTCHIVQTRLLEEEGELSLLDAAAQAHVASCPACGARAAAVQADVALLQRLLPASAPDGPPPALGSRSLPSLALAEGRTLPGWWFAVPAAAAAAVVVLAGIWGGMQSTPERPRVAGVQIEPISGAEWSQVMGLAADRQASSPVGPLVDRVLDGVSESNGASESGGGGGGR